jgi:DnaJ-class molecular chaperone
MDNPTLEVIMEDSARSEAARQMGRARTERKAAAARENGKRGGRPMRERKAAKEVQVSKPDEVRTQKAAPTSVSSPYRECPWCNGTGKEMGQECHRCHGTGRI